MSGAARKPSRRPLLLLLVLLIAGLLAGFGNGMRLAWFTSNDVTTGETRAYPELAARVYSHPPAEVFERMVEIAGSVRRWKVVRSDPQSRTMEVEVRTALFNFTDDLTGRVQSAEGGGSRVVLRSRSRVGRGDLGENARHIAALQRRMDAALRPE